MGRSASGSRPSTALLAQQLQLESVRSTLPALVRTADGKLSRGNSRSGPLSLSSTAPPQGAKDGLATWRPTGLSTILKGTGDRNEDAYLTSTMPQPPPSAKVHLPTLSAGTSEVPKDGPEALPERRVAFTPKPPLPHQATSFNATANTQNVLTLDSVPEDEEVVDTAAGVSGDADAAAAAEPVNSSADQPPDADLHSDAAPQPELDAAAAAADAYTAAAAEVERDVLLDRSMDKLGQALATGATSLGEWLSPRNPHFPKLTNQDVTRPMLGHIEPPSRDGAPISEWVKRTQYMYDVVQGRASDDHVLGATSAPFDAVYNPSLSPNGRTLPAMPESINALYGADAKANAMEGDGTAAVTAPSADQPLTKEDIAMLHTLRAHEAGATSLAEYRTLCEEAGQRLRHVLVPPLPHGAQRWAHESNFSPWNLPDYDFGKRALIRGDALAMMREAKDRADAALYLQRRNRDLQHQTVLTHMVDRVEDTLARSMDITNRTLRPPLNDPVARLMRDRNDAVDALKQLIERKGGTKYLARRLELEGGLGQTVGPEALSKLLTEVGAPNSEQLASILLEDASRVYLETPKARREVKDGITPGIGLSSVAPGDFARLVHTEALKYQKPARLDPLAPDTRVARNCLNAPDQPLGETSRFYPATEAEANAKLNAPTRNLHIENRLGAYDIVRGSYHAHPVRGLGSMRQASNSVPYGVETDVDVGRANLAETTSKPMQSFVAALGDAAGDGGTITREAYGELVKSCATGVKPNPREVLLATNRADPAASGGVSVNGLISKAHSGRAPEFLKPKSQRRSEDGRPWDWDPSLDRNVREEASATLRAHFANCAPGERPPIPESIIPAGHQKRDLDAALPVFAMCTAKGNRGYSSIPLGEMYGSVGYPRPIQGDGLGWPTKAFTKYGPNSFSAHLQSVPGENKVLEMALSDPTFVKT